MTDAFIYDAIRSPRGKGRADGALNEVTALRLSALMLDALAARTGVTQGIEDVIWGNVTQVGEQGGCLARSAVLASGLDQAIPGLSINRFCASGLEAVNLAAQKVRSGWEDLIVAGGVAYTVGAMLFLVRRPWAHPVWHVCVLVGSSCHFAAVAARVALA